MKAASDKLTREQIRDIYEEGPEAVITLVEEMQLFLGSLGRRVANLESRANYEQLLLALDRDRDQAEKEYEHLFKALLLYLTRLEAEDPEKLASDALEELSRRLGEGKTFENLRQYTMGIARNLHFDAIKERRKIAGSLDDPDFHVGEAFGVPPNIGILERERERQEQEESRVRTECRQNCYRQIPEDDRKIVESYSLVNGHDKEHREKLAVELNLTLGTLRT
jgi:DNA-directed RNA polymerase specialized sigma24 family protein